MNRENGHKYATYNREVEHSFKREFGFDRWVQLFGRIVFLHPYLSFISALLGAEKHPQMIFNFGWILESPGELKNIYTQVSLQPTRVISAGKARGLSILSFTDDSRGQLYLRLTHWKSVWKLIFKFWLPFSSLGKSLFILIESRWPWCTRKFTIHRLIHNEFGSFCPKVLSFTFLNILLQSWQ